MILFTDTDKPSTIGLASLRINEVFGRFVSNARICLIEKYSVYSYANEEEAGLVFSLHTDEGIAVL